MTKTNLGSHMNQPHDKSQNGHKPSMPNKHEDPSKKNQHGDTSKPSSAHSTNKKPKEEWEIEDEEIIEEDEEE